MTNKRPLTLGTYSKELNVTRNTLNSYLEKLKIKPKVEYQGLQEKKILSPEQQEKIEEFLENERKKREAKRK